MDRSLGTIGQSRGCYKYIQLGIPRFALYTSNQHTDSEITASPKEAARNWCKAALAEPQARRLKNSSRGFTGDPANTYTAIVSNEDKFTLHSFPDSSNFMPTKLSAVT